MKKFLICFLCVTLLLPLCACSAGLTLEADEPKPIQTEEQEQKEETESSTEEAEKTLLVPDPLTWDKINAIPIASPEMTTDQLRQICVDYYRLQLSYQWTPSESFSYTIESYERTVDMKKDCLYMGSPYDGGKGNLYKIMNHYDPETGILTVGKTGEATTEYIGNNCSTASHWGWSRVSNSFRFNHTVSITEANGAVKLGPYKYENEGKNHVSTRDVCDANGEQVMFKSYAQLKLADGVVCYNGAGHVMMISGAAQVTYASDGSIDGKNSYVLVMEQTSSWEDVEINGESLSQQGRVDRKATFAELFKSSYLPFTIKEFIGQDPVEKGTATLVSDQTFPLSVDSLAKATVEANYEISDITARVTDENGKEVYSYTSNCSWLEYKKQLNTTIFPAKLSAFAKKGGHKIEILCRIGTGELISVYSGELTK